VQAAEVPERRKIDIELWVGCTSEGWELQLGCQPETHRDKKKSIQLEGLLILDERERSKFRCEWYAMSMARTTARDENEASEISTREKLINEFDEFPRRYRNNFLLLLKELFRSRAFSVPFIKRARFHGEGSESV
jgi:hypothetical protein